MGFEKSNWCNIILFGGFSTRSDKQWLFNEDFPLLEMVLILEKNSVLEWFVERKIRLEIRPFLKSNFFKLRKIPKNIMSMYRVWPPETKPRLAAMERAFAVLNTYSFINIPMLRLLNKIIKTLNKWSYWTRNKSRTKIITWDRDLSEEVRWLMLEVNLRTITCI